MQYNTVTAATILAEWHEYRDEDQPGGTTIRVYYFKREIEFTAFNSVGRKLMIFMDEPLPVGSRVRNLRDKNGTQIGRVPDGPVPSYEVETVIPVLSPWGIVEKTGMRLKRV